MPSAGRGSPSPFGGSCSKELLSRLSASAKQVKQHVFLHCS